MKRNLLLTIRYDGTAYHGWQKQPGQKTVQGTLEDALSSLLGVPLTVDGTSRTDAGVHALGQRASFQLDGDITIPTDRLAEALTNRLPGDIEVTRAEEKPPGFHARFDAAGKTYLYRILNAPRRNIFSRNLCCWIRQPLDTEAMRRAGGLMTGTRDFTAFQSAGGNPRETTVRTVTEVSISTCPAGSFPLPGAAESASEAAAGDGEPAGGMAGPPAEQSDPGKYIDILVTGDGFLYNMVRIMAGTMIEAGLGKLDPETVPDIIASGDRARAGETAPPWGLYLKEVYYGSLPGKY